jgi:fructokinase
VGNDALGTELKNGIKDLGLSDKHIQVNEFPTSTVSVKLDKNGSPDFIIHENVAWDHIRWNNDIQELAKKVDAVCFGSLAQRKPESEISVKSFLNATKPGCLKVFDINLRQAYYSKELITNSLIISDVLKLNDSELPVVAGYLGLNGDIENQLEHILNHFNLKFIVYTMGGNGSIIKSPVGSSISQAPSVQVADTIGAGDCFTAIFITGILKGFPLEEIHRKATEASAFVCTQKGATPKLNLNLFKN